MNTNDTNQPETQSEPSQARCAVPICSASEAPRFRSYWNSYRSGAISVDQFKDAVRAIEIDLHLAEKKLIVSTQDFIDAANERDELRRDRDKHKNLAELFAKFIAREVPREKLVSVGIPVVILAAAELAENKASFPPNAKISNAEPAS